MRRLLTLAKFPRHPSFPRKSIWLTGVPPKVQTFCWMVFHSKIATLDNLQKRGFYLANRCVLCGKDEESINHLFLRCEFAMSIWNRISSALSIFGPRANSVSNVFFEWKGMNCFPNFQGGSGFVLHAFMWFIWIERNNIIFNDNSTRETNVCFRAMLNVGRWMVAADLLPADQLQSWHRLIFDPG
ncbi:Putative ribonuclease H protein At1g65750 [Linum perenne]